MPPKKRAAAATSTSKGSRKKPAAAPALSAEHESLAQLYAATLTVAGFLAPKGVPCTLDRLVGPVRALGQTLTHAALKQIVSIDDRLVLRSFVGPTGESQPLLVMREQLKLVRPRGHEKSDLGHLREDRAGAGRGLRPRRTGRRRQGRAVARERAVAVVARCRRPQRRRRRRQASSRRRRT